MDTKLSQEEINNRHITNTEVETIILKRTTSNLKEPRNQSRILLDVERTTTINF